MPKVDETPSNLLPFVSLGLDFDRQSAAGQAIATCPFCDESYKFYVAMDTGKWDCKDCKRSGNPMTFLRQVYEVGNPEDLGIDELAHSRGLLHVETLKQWGVVSSVITGEWLVPGFNVNGGVCQLYRYITDHRSGKRILIATGGLPHGLFGVNLFDPNKEEVYICEGPWDGMALYEVLRITHVDENGKWSLTGSESSSMFAKANVVAVPGCNVFLSKWCELFPDKRVYLMFDNDHPRQVTLKNGTVSMIPPDGLRGMKNAANVMRKAEKPASKVFYLRWGADDDELAHDHSLPHGFDVRDALSQGEDSYDRVEKLSNLYDLFVEIPAEWLGGKTFKDGSVTLEPLFCDSWSKLIDSWRMAFKWTPGLERALAVMLASIASTGHIGDQIWAMVLGPASCGKSSLCEALAVAKDYVYSKSSFRGFHSGYKTDKDGAEDHSMIPRIAGKTLIIKDGDTLMQSKNKDIVLSEGRDLYDRVSRSSYLNGLDRNYEDISVTWIICGTGSLRQLDTSELGERFIKVCIMKGIDSTMERAVTRRSTFSIRDNLGVMNDGTVESKDTSEKIEAKRLTGGYVEYLRKNASRLLRGITFSDEAVELCNDLGEFVAYMRARPSQKQDEVAEREISTRLCNQFTLLAACLAVVLNKKSVDADVMAIVRKVATDTADGKMLDIVSQLYRKGSEGAETASVAVWIGRDEDKTRPMLTFLARINAVENFCKEIMPGISGNPRWKLTDRIAHLYTRVMQPKVAFK